MDFKFPSLLGWPRATLLLCLQPTEICEEASKSSQRMGLKDKFILLQKYFEKFVYKEFHESSCKCVKWINCVCTEIELSYSIFLELLEVPLYEL